MTKFILGLIALILIALTSYTFINPKSEESSSSMVIAQQARKTEVPPKQIEAAIVGTKVAGISSKPTIMKYVQRAKKMVKSVPQKISNNTVEKDEHKIGEDFILNSIEDKDINEEEKEFIRDNIIYYQEIHAESFESIK